VSRTRPYKEVRRKQSRSREARIAPRLLWLGALVVAALTLLGYGVVWWRDAGGRGGAPVGATGGADSAAATASSAPLTVPRVDQLDSLDPAVADAISGAIAAVEHDRSSGAAWGELGVVYNAHRYYALAERCYLEAARLEPRVPDWPYLLGVLAEERGDAAEAAKRYRMVIERAPEQNAARYRLGNALLATGDVDRAERAYAELEAGAPLEPWGALGMGRVAMRRGSPRDAVIHFERAHQDDPDNAQIAYLLAGAYRELGDQEAVRRLIEPARDGVRPGGPPDPILDRVRTGVRSLQSMVNAANKKLVDGDAKTAEALYTAVLEIDPQHYDALYNLGLLYGRRGRFAEAQSFLERAIAARPQSAQARFLLALSLASQDRVDAARAELRALLELDPAHTEARKMLARIGP
jgi:tetratricopeptide (TPR) repeat protein